MIRLILPLAIGLIIYFVYRHITAMPAPQRRAAWLKAGLAALVIIVAAATVSGRMNWVGAAITGALVAAVRLLPILFRLFPVLQWLQRQRGPQTHNAGQQSSVETALLKMTLDHDSGDIHGEVLAGEFQGAQLDDLDREQLQTLLNWCEQQDADSAKLLENYLQRRYGGSQDDTQSHATDASGPMSRAAALSILGLREGAGKEEIIAAHRQLMQKLHPDRGGNDYLAAQLNQAKDLLLG